MNQPPLVYIPAFPKLRVVHCNFDPENVDTQEESTQRRLRAYKARSFIKFQISESGFWNIAQCIFLMPDKAAYPSAPHPGQYNPRRHYLGVARILEHLLFLQEDSKVGLPVVGFAGEFSSSRRWPAVVFAQWIESNEPGWHIYSSKLEESVKNAKPINHAFPADCLLLHC